MSKMYCTNHEGFTENRICGKCKSQNVFPVFKNTRFPKHPKKRDFQEVFWDLTCYAGRCGNINETKVIHKYISTHRYNNALPPGRHSDRSHKEIIQDVLDTRMKSVQEKQENSKYQGWHEWKDHERKREIQEVFFEITSRTKTSGWIIPAIVPIFDSGTYDTTSVRNYFKPVKGNINDGVVFNTEREAKIVSTYIAQQCLSNMEKFEDTTFNKYMKRTAGKTKLDIRKEFPEVFI